jgi:hypothetical protein
MNMIPVNEKCQGVYEAPVCWITQHEYAMLTLKPRILQRSNLSDSILIYVEEYEKGRTSTENRPENGPLAGPQAPKVTESGYMPAPTLKTFTTGAIRYEVGYRFDLICPTALKRLAETYDEGAKKYADYNWCKGIPTSNMVNHAIAHLVAFMQGDKSEDHLAHAMWNVVAIIHNESGCVHHEVAEKWVGFKDEKEK